MDEENARVKAIIGDHKLAITYLDHSSPLISFTLHLYTSSLTEKSLKGKRNKFT